MGKKKFIRHSNLHKLFAHKHFSKLLNFVKKKSHSVRNSKNCNQTDAVFVGAEKIVDFWFWHFGDKLKPHMGVPMPSKMMEGGKGREKKYINF